MPIDAMLFGGRRSTVVPLVHEARDWEHGVFLGSIDVLGDDRRGGRQGRQAALGSDGDAAVLRLPHGRLLPPLAGRSASATGRKLPRIFYVNWFRKDEDGKFLWPGYGENSRVLAWIFRRCEGTAKAQSRRRSACCRRSARAGSTSTASTSRRETMGRLLEVDVEGWKQQLPQMHEHYAEFGEKLPAELRAQLDALEERLRA